jgi:hypothetical protein
MSFNKAHLPELQKLLKIRENYQSNKDFLDDYLGSPDMIIGPLDSMEYIKMIRNESNGEKPGK